jgi:uncharacterized BrkB/YihY/UPF0761 family membrane protein
LWIYYSVQIFLLGAEFTRVYASRHGSKQLDPAVLGPLVYAGAVESDAIKKKDVTIEIQSAFRR